MNDDSEQTLIEEEDVFECPRCGEELEGLYFELQRCACGWQNPINIYTGIPNNNDNA